MKSYMDRLPIQFCAFSEEELESSVVDRFRSIVSKYGNRLAVKVHHQYIDYSSLERKSNVMAHVLLEMLGSEKEPVAMMFKHGLNHISTTLAVLKTGKFYSNLDCDLDYTRQALILTDLETRILLCDSTCLRKAEFHKNGFPALKIINIENLHLSSELPSPPIKISPNDFASIVYTSGSTGAPQGVVLSHQNILANARNHGHDFCLSVEDRATQICPLWTAASGSEIFSALLNGTSLFPFSIKDDGIVNYLALLCEENITTITATPVLFRMIFSAARQNQKFPSMRLIRLGGDRTTRAEFELFKQHFHDHCLLRLGYGSSEFMQITQLFLDKSYHPVGEILPIGFPMRDCDIRLLDDTGKQVANGAYGEISVASKFLSVGYWHNKALTEERFLTVGAKSGPRRYLTRDIGYEDSAGCLHHLGRKDSQVKIYGKMVLISDVEKALLGIAGVSEAVVTPFDSGERGTELAAFVVVVNEGLTTQSIRTELAKKIALDIMPRRISILEKMPLLINNKINRLKLHEISNELVPAR